MSSIGSPIQTSLIQTAQAQQVAGKSRDREKSAASDSARRMADQVDLRVAGVEGDDAVRRLPGNDSEQAAAERRARRSPQRPSRLPETDRVDLTA
jgi:hypothetical protein